jgi:hypothetical protein
LESFSTFTFTMLDIFYPWSKLKCNCFTSRRSYELHTWTRIWTGIVYTVVYVRKLQNLTPEKFHCIEANDFNVMVERLWKKVKRWMKFPYFSWKWEKRISIWNMTLKRMYIQCMKMTRLRIVCISFHNNLTSFYIIDYNFTSLLYDLISLLQILISSNMNKPEFCDIISNMKKETNSSDSEYTC